MIPLLSPKKLLAFAPDEFRAYVRSLFHKPEPRRAEKKVKRPRDYPIRVKATKKGKLSVVSKRTPRYFTEEELSGFARELGRGENEIFLALKAKGFTKKTHEEAEEAKGK